MAQPMQVYCRSNGMNLPVTEEDSALSSGERLESKVRQSSTLNPKP